MNLLLFLTHPCFEGFYQNMILQLCVKSVTDGQGVISSKQLPKRQKKNGLTPFSTHWILLISTHPIPTLLSFCKLTVKKQKYICDIFILKIEEFHFCPKKVRTELLSGKMQVVVN